MKNIKELRDILINTLDKLQNGEVNIQEAKQTANLAGKIINTAKVQLEYNIYTQSNKRVAFLESDE